MIEKARAKINLHLSVLARRDDGYHNIQSVMCPVRFADELRVVSLKKCPGVGNLHLAVRGPFSGVCNSIPLQENLVYRAFREYVRTMPHSAEVSLELTKNIPSGAGLGGGSSDAAAMLRILNRAFRYYSRNALMRIAEKLGADVPFCLFNRPALCEGTGGILRMLPVRFKGTVLLVPSAHHVSTKSAFETLDRVNRECVVYRRSEIRKRMKQNDFSMFFNDFENVVFADYPEIGRIKEQIIEYNPEFCMMTGSGSALFALFNDDDSCRQAYNEFAKQYGAILTKLIY